MLNLALYVATHLHGRLIPLLIAIWNMVLLLAAYVFLPDAVGHDESIWALGTHENASNHKVAAKTLHLVLDYNGLHVSL